MACCVIPRLCECKQLQCRTAIACDLGIARLLVGCGPRSDRLEVTGDVTLTAPRWTDRSASRRPAAESYSRPARRLKTANSTFLRKRACRRERIVVEISSPDTTAPPVRAKSAPGNQPCRRRRPSEFPRNTIPTGKHTIEVTADGDNHFTFDIQSRRNEVSVWQLLQRRNSRHENEIFAALHWSNCSW